MPGPGIVTCANPLLVWMRPLNCIGPSWVDRNQAVRKWLPHNDKPVRSVRDRRANALMEANGQVPATVVGQPAELVEYLNSLQELETPARCRKVARRTHSHSREALTLGRGRR